MRVRAGAILALLMLGGCAEDPLRLGGQCDLNSDCEAPLVCRFERCRNECVDNRDCPPGTTCVLDGEGLGSCTLPEEEDCSSPDGCPQGLACVEGACRNTCEEMGDCAGGLECRPPAGGGNDACFGPAGGADGGADAGPDAGMDGGPGDGGGADSSPATGDGGVVPCEVDAGIAPCGSGCEAVQVSAGARPGSAPGGPPG